MFHRDEIKALYGVEYVILFFYPQTNPLSMKVEKINFPWDENIHMAAHKSDEPHLIIIIIYFISLFKRVPPFEQGNKILLYFPVQKGGPF